MSLTKSKGNMYSFVTHTHAHLAGECPHRCGYCYAQAMARRFKTERWTGPLRLIEGEFNVNYGTGKTVFIEHMNDLFADAVPFDWIARVLAHCWAWPDNTYVLQTKNPARLAWVFLHRLPPKAIIGTTLESNRIHDAMLNAPRPEARHLAMLHLRAAMPKARLFCTIEPVMDFDLDEMLKIAEWRPDFVNIGADSKGGKLPEPSAEKIRSLIDGIKELGIEIRQKTNLERLLKP